MDNSHTTNSSNDFKSSSFQKLKYLPATFWLLVILILSGYPGNQLPKVPIWQFDKLIHSVIYSILSIVLIIAFQKQYAMETKRFLLIIGIVFFGIFYGGIMEILQHFIFINRSGNWYDFIANTIGVTFGVLFYPLIIKLIPIKRWLNIK
ncbi:MAG: hypothetical protein A3K10_14655 [Bacteroidetes bacterium RIFCSPLOWO2_12_FULL_31_6]|nr:MAG: hypothetical protein A3K10_14655 [Bacteroidetes bacterium RIFCSPLOWO2_12_FULL_31_6]